MPILVPKRVLDSEGSQTTGISYGGYTKFNMWEVPALCEKPDSEYRLGTRVPPKMKYLEGTKKKKTKIVPPVVALRLRNLYDVG